MSDLLPASRTKLERFTKYIGLTQIIATIAVLPINYLVVLSVFSPGTFYSAVVSGIFAVASIVTMWSCVLLSLTCIVLQTWYLIKNGPRRHKGITITSLMLSVLVLIVVARSVIAI